MSSDEPSLATCMAAQVWCRPECGKIEMDVVLATAFAEVLQEQLDTILELQEFAIWMTGCGYDFASLPHFCEQRDKLLK